MPVYDDQQNGRSTDSLPGDDELRRITGINKEQESAHDRSAYNGAADDILNREQSATKGGSPISNLRAGKKESKVDKAGLRSKEAATPGGIGGSSLNPANNLSPLNKIQGFFTKHKKAGAGGLLGTLMLGGAFAIFTTASGPLQIMSLGNILTSANFAPLNNQNDNRFTSMLHEYRVFKASRGKAGFERTRMGTVGNYAMDKVEAKMKAQGIELKYVRGTNGLVFDGTVIDPAKFSETRGMKPDAAAKYIQDKYGLREKPSLISGKGSAAGRRLLIRPDTSARGYFSYRRFQKGMLKTSGYSKLSGSIAFRGIKAREGFTLNPIRNYVKRKTGEKLSAKEKARLNKEKTDFIEGKSKVTLAAQAAAEAKDICEKNTSKKDCEKAKKKAKKAKEVAKKQKGVAKDLAKEGEAASKSAEATGSEAVKGFKSDMVKKLKGGLGPTVAIAVVCALKAVNDNWGKMKEAQVIKPLIRTAAFFISIGSQVQDKLDSKPDASGQLKNKMNLDALGYYTQPLQDNSKPDKDDPNAGSSWNQAEGIRQAQLSLGYTDVPQTTKGTIPPDDTLKGIGQKSPFRFFNVPGIAQVAAVTCSPVTGFFVGVISFAFGGAEAKILKTVAQAIANGAITAGIVKLVDMIVPWLMHHPVNPNATGARLGNQAAYGARLAANSQAISQAGNALSNSEASQLLYDERSQQEAQFASSSFTTRLFDKTNPRSLVARIANHQNPDIMRNMASLSVKFTNIWRVFAQIPATIFGHQAIAAVSGVPDYGFPAFNFSDAEMAKAEPPFKNSVKAAQLLDGSKGKSYIKRASKCYQDDLTPIKDLNKKDANGNEAHEWDVIVTTGSDDFDPYLSKYQKNNCDSDSSDWLSIRFFIFDTTISKSVACYHGDKKSCEDTGMSGTPVGNDSPQAGDSPVGDPQKVAKEILASGNVSYQYDAETDVKLAAQGKNGTCNKPIDPRALQLVLDISKNHKISVSAFESQCKGHMVNSDHYKGEAVDIAQIDGIVAYKKMAKVWPEISPAAKRGAVLLQHQCPGAPAKLPDMTWLAGDTCTHQHIQYKTD